MPSFAFLVWHSPGLYSLSTTFGAYVFHPSHRGFYFVMLYSCWNPQSHTRWYSFTELPPLSWVTVATDFLLWMVLLANSLASFADKLLTINPSWRVAHVLRHDSILSISIPVVIDARSLSAMTTSSICLSCGYLDNSFRTSGSRKLSLIRSRTSRQVFCSLLVIVRSFTNIRIKIGTRPIAFCAVLINYDLLIFKTF